MSKKLLLIISGAISLISIGANYLGSYKICGSLSSGDCPFTVHDTFLTIIVFIPVFIISLFTYKVRIDTFNSWLKFVYIWIPLTIILTILAPEYSLSLLPITKGLVSVVMSVLFLLISAVIIGLKSVFLKDQDTARKI